MTDIPFKLIEYLLGFLILFLNTKTQCTLCKMYCGLHFYLVRFVSLRE
jgi:hypothetical protein